MKCWVVDYHDDDTPSGSARLFRATRAEAEAAAAELDRKPPPGGYFRSEPREIKVPTTKAALLVWLNTHASGR